MRLDKRHDTDRTPPTSPRRLTAAADGPSSAPARTPPVAVAGSPRRRCQGPRRADSEMNGADAPKATRRACKQRAAGQQCRSSRCELTLGSRRVNVVDALCFEK